MDTLLRALAIAREIVPLLCHIVGNGDDVERLDDLRYDLDMAETVIIVTGAREAAKRWYLRHCDLFVLPSTHEGFGLAHVEAMAAGKAVIGCLAGATAEVIEHGVSGLLVPAGDVGALAMEILCVLTDDALRHRLGDHARVLARQRFSYDRFRNDVKSLLDADSVHR